MDIIMHIPNVPIKEDEISERLKSFLILAAATGGFFIALKYILPWVAPFLIALALALVIEPPVRLLTAHFRFSRAAASGTLTLLFLGVFAFLAALIAGRLASELSELVAGLPQFIERLVLWLEEIVRHAKFWVESDVPGLDPVVLPILESLPGELARIAGSTSGVLISALPRIAGRTPEILLFAVTAGIGMYFISSEYAEIGQFVKEQIAPAHRTRVCALFKSFVSSLASWLKAQLILTFITFFEVLLALLLLRAEYAILMAAAVAVVDMLPILGTGAVLIPWAVLAFISGEANFALGIFIIWAAATLLRNLIQAKLVGDRLGLNPLVSLLSMYVGFRALGVMGMITMPLAVIMVAKLNDAGILKLWSKTEKRMECEKSRIHGNMQKRNSKTI